MTTSSFTVLSHSDAVKIGRAICLTPKHFWALRILIGAILCLAILLLIISGYYSN